jgi:hypothetical protein
VPHRKYRLETHAPAKKQRQNNDLKFDAVGTGHGTHQRVLQLRARHWGAAGSARPISALDAGGA